MSSLALPGPTAPAVVVPIQAALRALPFSALELADALRTSFARQRADSVTSPDLDMDGLLRVVRG
ncbi:hypothetical protein GB931_05530 [Modestobacter sp. I12A-02628]|uniref:Uncharacterized protein n=1 Tax=Goekera deserti TaxID=2497753 RepID=A0A7K3WDZ8_9ACTN|nr:hypothetical protein [Goekera deserti]MPQ97394.1 hypothetical protein [Goekera deserti]NDI48005.1 hypothetical protein [Goekera deserti]NEL53753.1 hypothetical protein [Goekera deserti]